MVNTQRGEVLLQVGDDSYTLESTSDALCQIESVLGCSILKTMNEMSNPDTASLTNLRAMLWGLLRKHHKNMTLIQAGDLIVPAGGMIEVLKKINDAMAVAFPPPKDDDGPPLEPGQSLTGSAIGIAG